MEIREILFGLFVFFNFSVSIDGHFIGFLSCLCELKIHFGVYLLHLSDFLILLQSLHLRGLFLHFDDFLKVFSGIVENFLFIES